MNNPIIVVGRPRSGSTLFTRILNESQDLFVVNDFYYLQYVDSLGGFDRQDPELLSKLGKHILLTLKDRFEPDYTGVAGIESAEFLTPEREKKLTNFIDKTLNQNNHNWSSLFGSIMQYCAHLFGKTSWGYNTPQDYLHLSRLEAAFPQAKFIFMMRNPCSVLRSYKYMEFLEGYHDPARYHPILQAIGWKSAMKSFLKHRHQENVTLVRYEDLINDANQTLDDIGDFVESEFPQLDINSFGNNSTFKNKQKNPLSNTEVWLCEQIASQEIRSAGYSLQLRKPLLKDFKNIFYLTFRSFQFYLKNSLTSKDIRKRVLNLVKARLVENT